MNLKITIFKVEHNQATLDKVASILIAKSDLFCDSGEKQILEGTFTSMTKFAQAVRAIKRAIWKGGGNFTY